VPTHHLTIREFEPGDEAPFRQLNEEWITRYFRIETKDEEALADPQSSILASGGGIFFASYPLHARADIYMELTL
jgi:putative acetyltransferase